MNDEELRKILEDGLVHRAMVFFNRPASWPGWLMLLVMAFLGALVGLEWRLLQAPANTALAVALLLAAVMAGDAFLFWLLPRLQISFGSWKSQTIVLAVPRTAAALVLPLVALLFDWQGALLTAVIVQLVGTLLLVYGAYIEPRRLEMTRLDIEVPNLPPEARPIRLLHISDIHVERLTGREEALLSLVKAAQADAILITGDYLNLSYNEDDTAQAQVRQLLSRLHAPHGVYATLGSPTVDLWREVPLLFEDLHVRLLRNDWVQLDFGDGRQVVVLGLDCTHHMDKDAACLEQVLQQAPEGVPRILLYHSPEIMPQASQMELDLYLCGHTHGGQVRLPFYGAILTSSQLGKRYVMGHYQECQTHLYVSRGVGLEGLSAPRVRLLAPPEITLVTLRPSTNGANGSAQLKPQESG